MLYGCTSDECGGSDARTDSSRRDRDRRIVRDAKTKAPILGLYGGNDARVNANIPVAEAELKKVGASYTPTVFDGAGHGFLRQQAGANDANMAATEKAWPMTLAFLRKYAETGAAKSQ